MRHRQLISRLALAAALAATAACAEGSGTVAAPEVEQTSAAAVQLTVEAAVGTGLVTSSPAGIRCEIVEGVARGTCTADFPVGAVVSVSASASAADLLADWRGACYGIAACQVAMEGERRLRVSFLPASAIRD